MALRVEVVDARPGGRRSWRSAFLTRDGADALAATGERRSGRIFGKRVAMDTRPQTAIESRFTGRWR
jgi:hypothetical protein